LEDLYYRIVHAFLGPEGDAKMTTELFYERQKRKKLIITSLDNEQVQLDWINGLLEQIEFANRPEVLPDYILQLKIARRRLEP
jgi:hypothetical protein